MKWRVQIHKVRIELLEVEADDYEGARLAAMAASADRGWHVTADVREQLGEPWVSTHGWYHLSAPAHVIVFERALGHVFTSEDVDLLVKRVARLGLTVREHWNGAESGSLSIRVAKRRSHAPMSAEDIAMLCAPRAETTPDATAEPDDNHGDPPAMNHHYADIRDRIPEAPRWWDEHGVPRYCEFSPRQTADIYARECCLLLIECQDCGQQFEVCMSRGLGTVDGPTLAERIDGGTIHYGDPPNVGCCAAGPTMNSIPRRVLQYWDSEKALEWVRHSETEIDVTPGWARKEDSDD